eukprot:TRINITY_DN12547_c0_g2_i1.p1 TRINITY_DN12547_c0_g2~~TRINITY_DN12547_c0_g2_i1.p1  ORF type:complete len:184 (-),score=48.21 TRINITY_DN12547_c0_g2_i1:3-554(-)
MSSFPKNIYQERGLGVNTFGKLDSNVALSLGADDPTGEAEDRARTNRLQWDRKKKKFFRAVDQLDSKKRKVRTESGVYIEASYKTDKYRSWAKNTKTAIPLPGQPENKTQNAVANLKRKRYRHQKKNDKAAGGGVSNAALGLRNKDQIHKERKRKEKIHARQQRGFERNQKRKKRRGGGKKRY